MLSAYYCVCVCCYCIILSFARKMKQKIEICIWFFVSLCKLNVNAFGAPETSRRNLYEQNDHDASHWDSNQITVQVSSTWQLKLINKRFTFFMVGQSMNYIHSNFFFSIFHYNNGNKYNNESSHWLFNDYVFYIFSSELNESNLANIQRNITIWITLNNRLESFSQKRNAFKPIKFRHRNINKRIVLSDIIEFLVNSIV